MKTTLTFPGAHGPRPMRQTVTENIRALMARRGIRQPQIMALLDLSQPAVSRRLNGQLAWNIDELERIAMAFEVSVAELLDTAPEGTPSPLRTDDRPTREYDALDRSALALAA